MFEGYDPRAIANEFIQAGIEDDNPVTPMEVQKLMFFAHGWMLGLHATPMHYGEWEAWKHGPVLPVIYHNLSYAGAQPVTKKIHVAGDVDLNNTEQEMIGFIHREYRPMGALRLSRLTHVKGSPWDQVKRKRWGGNVIPNDLIQEYFSKVARKVEAMHA